VDRAEQQEPHKAAEPPVHGRPRGKSFGSIRQPPPLRAMVRIALSTSRRSVVGLRPRLGSAGSSGWIRCHASSVRSAGHRLVLRAISTIGLQPNPSERCRQSRQAATAFSGPHPELPPQPDRPANPFSNGLSLTVRKVAGGGYARRRSMMRLMAVWIMARPVSGRRS
jgi:hypothetical protein